MCVLQRLGIAAAFVAAGLVSTVAASSATVVPIFTLDSHTITAGEKGVLHLHLNLTPDSSKDYDAQFASGVLTLYSGNGASTTFQLGSGGTSRDFTYAFDYTVPGSYTPSFMHTGSFTQKHDDYVHLYDYAETVPALSPKCRTCVSYTTQLIHVFGWKTFSDSESFSLGGSLTMTTTEPVVTPLPAALPLYASGLGVIGLLAWCKRRRAARTA
jgi:hypothetical protein